MKTLFLSITLTLFIVTSAQAHDAKLHQGPMLKGELISLKNDKASIKTSEGEVTILLSPETKFEAGMEGKKAEKTDLKQGQQLMVMGHKLEDGEFAAAEVIMHEKADSYDHHSMNK